jgi:Ca-activated chloride channel family protein
MRKTLISLVLAAVVAGCAAPVHNATALVPARVTTSQEKLPGPHLSGNPSSALVAANRELSLTLRIALDAKDLPRPPRPGLNVALCIDTSGSMEGKAIDDARKAALAFVDALKPGDWVSVVTFDSKSNVLVPSSQVDESCARGSVR